MTYLKKFKKIGSIQTTVSAVPRCCTFGEEILQMLCTQTLHSMYGYNDSRRDITQSTEICRARWFPRSGESVRNRKVYWFALRCAKRLYSMHTQKRTKKKTRCAEERMHGRMIARKTEYMSLWSIVHERTCACAKRDPSVAISRRCVTPQVIYIAKNCARARADAGDKTVKAHTHIMYLCVCMWCVYLVWVM